MHKIVLIVHDVRSTHNVGSILRSADGLGIEQIYFTGYTPYPEEKNDKRLPHLRTRLDKQIHKTALGAEKTVAWSHTQNVASIITKLRSKGFLIAALEQTKQAKPLNQFCPKQAIALIIGNEVDGINKEVLDLTDIHLEIPMKGQKESFNVGVAASIAMYHLKEARQKS